jgi:hypothetical protein
MTCRQIRNEMGLLPYSALPIYIGHLGTFAKWVNRRSPAQRSVITHVNLLNNVVMDGITDQHRMLFHPSPTRDYTWMAKLDNLARIHVLMRTYQREGTLDPRASPKLDLWAKRAQLCADEVTCDAHLRGILASTLQPRAVAVLVTGEWEGAVMDETEKLGIENKMAEDGFVRRNDANGVRWVVAPPAPVPSNVVCMCGLPVCWWCARVSMSGVGSGAGSGNGSG